MQGVVAFCGVCGDPMTVRYRIRQGGKCPTITNRLPAGDDGGEQFLARDGVVLTLRRPAGSDIPRRSIHWALFSA